VRVAAGMKRMALAFFALAVFCALCAMVTRSGIGAELVGGLAVGVVIGFGLFCALFAMGAAAKCVQWVGKRLGVEPFNL
jgi:hypothetical protein